MCRGAIIEAIYIFPRIAFFWFREIACGVRQRRE
jgi:hypothetical protein